MFSKTVFYEDDEFQLRFEYVDGMLFLHCVVYKPSKAAYKKGMALLERAKDMAHFFGEESLFTYTDNKTMARLTHAELISYVVDSKGKSYGVYKWGLEQRYISSQQ